MDTCIVMLESVGYHGCSQRCIDAGGIFDSNSSPFRGHLGPSFYISKVVLGLLSDVVYCLHIFIGFCTVCLRMMGWGCEAGARMARPSSIYTHTRTHTHIHNHTHTHRYIHNYI